MAKKKAAGRTNNGRDSKPKSRGIKAHGGAFVKCSSIIAYYIGSKFKAGKFAYEGRTHNVHAGCDGYVHFRKNARGSFIDIIPENGEALRDESKLQTK